LTRIYGGREGGQGGVKGEEEGFEACVEVAGFIAF
jgi:hypothetical protein